MIIVCAGNLRNGYLFYGPFNSTEDARSFIESLIECDGEIFQLVPPEHAEIK